MIIRDSLDNRDVCLRTFERSNIVSILGYEKN